MKCWFVYHINSECEYEEGKWQYYGVFSWGETRGKAIMNSDIYDPYEYVGFRARRAAMFDGEPRELTDAEIVDAGYTGWMCDC